MAPTNYIARRVKFLGLDGLMVAPMLGWFIKPSLTALYIIIIISAILFIFSKRGFTVQMLLRRLRTIIAGRFRFIRPPWRARL